MVIEEKLRHKKIHLKQVIDEYTVLKQKCEKSRHDNKDEKMNQYGISKNSEVCISILEANSLKPMSFSGSIDPYVMIICDGKDYYTSKKENSVNPIWNEDFQL